MDERVKHYEWMDVRTMDGWMKDVCTTEWLSR